MNENFNYFERQSPLAQTPVLNRPILTLGDQGEYVKLLQLKLQQLMFYSGEIDGNFDNETLLSVKAFQTNNKLPVTGVVDNATWSALIFLYEPLAICNGNIHIVQPGDTLYSIARAYNTTVEDIMNLNNLTTTLLQIGQELQIPTKPTIPEEIIIHIVKPGDTLWSISRQYNTTVDEIMRLNNLTSTLLSIGEQLIIKGAPQQVPEEPEKVTYTVKKGDTLYSIARNFKTTVDEIKRINNLKSNLLNIGQTLLIPKETPIQEFITYTVKKGDTLYSIANRFNTTVESIKTLNTLTSNLLSIGQVLKI